VATATAALASGPAGPDTAVPDRRGRRAARGRAAAWPRPAARGTPGTG